MTKLGVPHLSHVTNTPRLAPSSLPRGTQQRTRKGASTATQTLTWVPDSGWRGILYVEPVQRRYRAADIVQAWARFQWSGSSAITLAHATFNAVCADQGPAREEPQRRGQRLLTTFAERAQPVGNRIKSADPVAMTSHLELPGTVANH